MSGKIYAIEEHSSISNDWCELIRFESIVSAVADYKYLTNEYPDTSYRIIEIHEVTE